MNVLTNDQYRERGERNQIGKSSAYSLLNTEELNLLRMCVIVENPKRGRDNAYHQLAARPVGAMHYCNAVQESVWGKE